MVARSAWIAFRAGLASLSLLLPPSSGAQEGPQGLGFVQAEEGTWWCRDKRATDAFACAREQCTLESGGQDCHATRWCYPSGWAGLMIVWLPEFHSTHVVCGMPGREATRAALEAICRTTPEFSLCELVMLIDPDGETLEISETIEPLAESDSETPSD